MRPLEIPLVIVMKLKFSGSLTMAQYPVRGKETRSQTSLPAFVCMAAGLCWELKAPRIQTAGMRFFPLSFAFLFLAWELTGEETLEGFVDFPAIVINISVGPRGFGMTGHEALCRLFTLPMRQRVNASGG